jgi:Trehalose utilisation/PKD domain
VFSKTHDSIEEGIAAIRALGRANEFQVDATEDATVFRDSVLAHYDTVVFLSTTGDPLNNIQQAAFQRYIRAGGGFTGIHAAADTEYDWNWYGHLVGGYFLSHPPGTPTATIDVEDLTNRSTEHLPHRWERTDEWYTFGDGMSESGRRVSQGGALSYRWTFGDDSDSMSGREVTHEYRRRGTHTARVTVSDPEGARRSAELRITVTRSGGS